MQFLFQDAAVYCGTYHKYNCGSLFGKWLNLTDYSDGDELDEALRELHSDESDPEFMFQDTENFPEFICSGEPSWHEVVRCIEFANYNWDDCWDEDIINAAVNYESDLAKASPEEIEHWLEEHYFGHYPDPADYAYDNLLEDCPEHLISYIDLKRLGEDVLDEYGSFDDYYFN